MLTLGLETGNIKESTSNSPVDGCMQWTMICLPWALRQEILKNLQVIPLLMAVCSRL